MPDNTPRPKRHRRPLEPDEAFLLAMARDKLAAAADKWEPTAAARNIGMVKEADVAHLVRKLNADRERWIVLARSEQTTTNRSRAASGRWWVRPRR
jgi:hypothetical protein